MLAKTRPDLSPGRAFFTACAARPPAARRPHQRARNSRERQTPPPHRPRQRPQQMARRTEQSGTATSQRHRQTGRQATRHGQTHDTQQQTQQTPPARLRDGRGPGTGRDTRRNPSRRPGYRQARPPNVAGSARLRGACLGLAGRFTGRQSRPQAAFPRAPPRAKRGDGGACAASARGGQDCGPPQGREPNKRR